ncbi:glycosyltransferase [Rhodanobacter sp. 7MK24]|uniref:glycosyltransferase n=1 Tax=Rhodanobacter sp. 7MK24 TaxID=2775922 RepID=UPI00177F9000|nr:glycosyltransferase [Rhodanobacter sp. 7MK24]MBD8881906.1 glycosyltransferase [Rhodanobacter sp. 7MK24]
MSNSEATISATTQQAMQQQIDALQQRIDFMQQFFEEHALREKPRHRRHDAERLERVRSSPRYDDAYGEQPLVSIIVPTYQRARIFIERGLPSVLRQDYTNWELLVIGDCMAEEQAALLREAATIDPRVHFHNLRHRGKYPTMKAPMWYVAGTKPYNFGLRVARGSWIAVLNDDDEYLPNHLSSLLDVARANRVEWVHGNVRFLDDHGNEQGVVGNAELQQGGISSISSLCHAGLKTFRSAGTNWKYCCPGDWDTYERLLAMGVTHAYMNATTAIHHGDYFRTSVLEPHATLSIASHPTSPREQYRQWLEPQRLSPAQAALAEGRQAPCKVDVFVIDVDGNPAEVQTSLDSLAAQQHRTLHVTVLSDRADMPGDDADTQPHRGDWAARINELAATSDADWLLPLFAGDELAPHALLLLADNSGLHPEHACCYVDEDARGDEGYGQPVFKPDLNLDMLRSYPYPGRVLAMRREVLLALGGLDAQHGPLAHYDFVFRCIEQQGLASVGHLAEVLYHASQPFGHWLSSPSVREHSAAIVANHLDRLGIAHDVATDASTGIHRVRYLNNRQPPVSIIIPTRDQLPMLNGLIDSLLAKTSYRNYELLIVDNDSRDTATCAYLDGIESLNNPQLRVLRWPHPFNYSAINNFAAAQARGEYLVLLNNDTAVLHDDWIEALLNHAQRPEVGIVGAKLHYPDGRIQHAGVVLGLRGPADHPYIGETMDAPGYMHRLLVDQNYTAVTAACLMIRKSVYDEVGGLDEQDFKVSYNDVDLCLKTHRAGYLTVWTPYARLMHEGSVSQTKVDKTDNDAKAARFRGEQEAMYRKWLPLLARDPAYNRNLSLTGSGFDLDATRAQAWQPFERPVLPNLFCIAADEAGCGHYRIMQPLHSMRRENLAEGMVSSTHFSPVLMERFAPDTIVLQRQTTGSQLRILRNYREFSRAFKVYELDDYLPNAPLKSVHRADIPKDILKSLRKAVSFTDRFVVSTAPLAEAFAGLHSDIRVVENRLPVEWWSEVRGERRKDAKPRVGWGGGSSHRGDLELIADVVRELADEVEWVFFGMCPEKLRPYMHEFHNGVPIAQYPAKLASLDLDLALAPLEDNLFNVCKSNLRLLEYGACGFPVVCSDIVCYRGDLPVTRVRNRFKEWVDAIRMHIADRDSTARMGDALREVVLRDWMLTGHNLTAWRDAWLPD